jgi:ATP-binding protein involved in chromosome partitioning
MEDKCAFVKKIAQKDLHTFTIEWTDGQVCDYRLSVVQRRCTCARCRDEKTGRLLIDPQMVDEQVSARKIENVGRYALKIEFTSGCSRGIYPFSFLRPGLV